MSEFWRKLRFSLKKKKEYSDWAVTSQDAKRIMTIIQNEDEKIKEVHMMPVRDIKATEGSKSSQQKINKTEESNGFG